MDQDRQDIARACAEEMYRNDQASSKLGIEIADVEVGQATATMVIEASMINGHDVCHGGYVFTLADTAFAFACNTHNQVTLAAAASIDFLAPAKLGDRLTATAVEVNRGRRTGIYDVRVTNQDGRLLATFRGRSVALDQPVLRSK